MSKPLTIQYTGKYANHLLREKEKEIERLNNIIKEQGLEDKPNYYVKGLEGSLKEYQEEVKRLNNNWNKLKEWANEPKVYVCHYHILDKMNEIEQGDNKEC